MLYDTHVHVWDLARAEYPWLAGDTSLLNDSWHIERLEPERKKTNVTGGVLVQASGNMEDTDMMLETARRTEWIEGVVVWLPLMDPNATLRQLEGKYLKEKYFKGVRHQIHDEKDDEWLLQPEVIESLKILEVKDIPYDIVAVKPGHIITAMKVAEKVPNLRMVFDHLSQPPISTQERFGKWGDEMKAASKHRNFYAKISGLGTASGNFANRTKDDIKPYVDFAVQYFGTDRCFCGGDWPVSVLAGSYSEIWKIYESIINESIGDKDSGKIYYDNAKRFYSL